MRNKYTKHTNATKLRAGRMFNTFNEHGQRVHSIKSIAKELGVTFAQANYLEYAGRKLLGAEIRTNAPKRRKISSSDSFVERSFYPVPSKGTSADALLLVALCSLAIFVIVTAIITPLIII